MSLILLLNDIASLPKNASSGSKGYMTEFIRVMGKLKRWTDYVATTWQHVMASPMSADDLLPFTITQLPVNQTAFLNKVNAKLEEASLIDCTGEAGYVMTNLSIAITFQLSDKNKDNLLPNVSQEMLEKMTHEIELCLHVDNLKTMLSVKIAERLKHLSEPVYFYFFKKSEQVDSSTDVIMRIIDKRYNKKFMTDDTSLNSMLDNYLAISDLLLTLTNPQCSQEEIREQFTEKYHLYKTTLEKNNDATTKALIKSVSAFLLTKKTLTPIPTAFFSPAPSSDETSVLPRERRGQRLTPNNFQ